MRPRQNSHHILDNIFKCIFLNENVWILIMISLKFVVKGPITNISVLVQIMAWCRSGDKPLSVPMMVNSLTHLFVTRPQWVKLWSKSFSIALKNALLHNFTLTLSLVAMHIFRLPGGRFKKVYELLNLRALKFLPVNKMHIFQCMDKIFCVEFQREPLKFHTKYLSHTLKDAIFIQHWNFKSSWI